MKVYFDGLTYGSQVYGGISRYSLALYNEIKVHHEAKIICLVSINKYLLAESNNLSLININKKVRYSHRLYEFLNFFYLYLYCLVNKPQVIHVTFYSFWFKFFKPKCDKLVVTVYDFIDERVGSLDNVSIRDKKYTLNAADQLLCISNNTQADLVNLYPEFGHKSSVVHFGFEYFKVLAKSNMKSGLGRFVLFVGQRSRYKNFKLLYESMKLLDDPTVRLVAFGPRPSNLELSYYKDVVFLTGGDELLVDLYRSALCFVFPSSYEGFGIPSLEAMSLGCPVVVPKSSCFPEIVGEAGSFFIDNDMRSLADQLNRLLVDQVYRDDLIVRGKARVKLFSYELCGKETMKYYV